MALTKKPLVCILIFLLTATVLVGVFSPAEAETWTDIEKLPYTIVEAGNYRITSPWNISGIGLSINASDVVVDGQNNLIQLTQAENEYAIRIAPGCNNVLLQNINQTRSDYGIFAEEASFTVQNSFFTNNTSVGVAALYSTDITVQHSMLSNNSYGVVTAYSEGGLVDDCHVKNCSIGIEAIFTNNFTVQNTYMNNNSIAMDAFLSQNLTIKSVMVNENQDGFNMYSCSLTVDNSTLTDNLYGIQCQNSSLTVINSEFYNGIIGVYSEGGVCAVSNSLLTNNIAGMFIALSNATVQDCTLNNNQIYGILTYFGNLTVYSCTINNNTAGLYSQGCPNLTIDGSSVFNNTELGLFDFAGGNTQVTSNIFSTNGLNNISAFGAIMFGNANCTVNNNIFERNNNALLLSITVDELNNTQIYHNNRFANNNFTFNFNYQLPSNYTNQQIYFYNNLVNDTSYINPESFTREYFPPNTVLHLNGTLQAGERVYSNGRMIGGNFWAFPNGTGPSQTTTDANHDGFADEPFDVFENLSIYDYLPYTTSYASNLTFTSGEKQSLIANQTSSAVTVKFSDYFGSITSGLIVNLSSNSTTTGFFSDATGINPITAITIPSGQSTATFYFKDTTAGNPTITVSAAAVNPDSATQTITTHSDTVDHIVIVPENPVIKAAQTINFTTTAYDQYGNSWNVTAEYAVNEAPFEGDSLNTIVPGVYLISSTFQGNETQTVLTVTHGDTDRFIVLTPNSAPADSAFLIRVVAVDSVGNIVTAFNGQVSLNANGTSVSPSTSGNFQNGEWHNSITISEAGTYILTASADGKTGSSRPFTVTLGSTTTPTPAPTPTVTPTPDTVVASGDNGTTVNVQLSSGNITSSQITNMEISTSQNQDNTITTISFNVSGPTGTTGFSNMTISKSQIPAGTTPKVYIDGELAANQGYTEDGQNFYVWYTTSFSVHNVKIEFTGQTAAPEEHPVLIYTAIIVLAALAAIVVLVLSRRKHK